MVIFMSYIFTAVVVLWLCVVTEILGHEFNPPWLSFLYSQWWHFGWLDLGMPTITVYMGPYLYRQSSWLLLYGMIYSMDVAYKTCSVLWLYSHK